MKITEIRAVRLTVPPRQWGDRVQRRSWAETAEVANPMSGYPEVKAHRSLWLPNWPDVWCKVTLEDGTWGLGQTSHGRAVAAVIRMRWRASGSPT
jgi:L-rhamnonate dehydratase